MSRFIGDLIRLIRGTANCVRCGHGGASHQHYRRGSDCALCDCGRWV